MDLSLARRVVRSWLWAGISRFGKVGFEAAASFTKEEHSEVEREIPPAPEVRLRRDDASIEEFG